MSYNVSMRALLAVAALASLVAAAQARAGSPPASIAVRPLVETRLLLGDVAWTGSRLLYIAETTGQIDQSGPGARRLRPFAALPGKGEEVRCRPAPTGHGFARGLYCHTADNRIYRVASSGRVTLFATLPERRTSDGALAFDTSGRFDHALLAATGRSNDRHGGAVFAVRADGSVAKLGSYPGPGGAENAAIAPPGFGAAAGDLLLTTDKAKSEGRVLAMDARGRVSTLATIRGDGLNSLAVVSTAPSGAPRPGLYITDTRSRSVWFAAARQLRRLDGLVVVAAELRGWLFVVEPARGRFRAVRLRTSLDRAHYNFEGAVFLG
jgi:hypothetical protein